ncbi:MAG: CHAT domain-containing protein [Nitrosomonas sp.]
MRALHLYKDAGKEVYNIKTLFDKVTDMPDKDFNSDAIFSQLSEHDIIHLATHAALVPGDLRQSFILSGDDEPITIDQIKYNWSLTNVDLFALSACNTAIGGIIGKGEEILGFGYLMESKGAKSTLASL